MEWKNFIKIKYIWPDMTEGYFFFFFLFSKIDKIPVQKKNHNMKFWIGNKNHYFQLNKSFIPIGTIKCPLFSFKPVSYLLLKSTLRFSKVLKLTKNATLAKENRME